jgi:hypothetical protein
MNKNAIIRLLLFISINSKSQDYREYWPEGNLTFDKNVKGYRLIIGIEARFLQKK